jgi:hypothetical protein
MAFTWHYVTLRGTDRLTHHNRMRLSVTALPLRFTLTGCHAVWRGADEHPGGD